MPRPKKPENRTATPIDLAAGHPDQIVDGPEQRKGIRLKGHTILPAPTSFQVQNEHSIKYMKWWAAFNDEQAGVCENHIYRNWPVINRAQIGERKPHCIDKIDGKIPFEAEEWEKHFLHRYGSGKYKLICTEKGVPGAIAMCKFTVEDADFPPRVQPAELVRGHPDNAGFIEGLKQRGIPLPWETAPVVAAPVNDEEEEMKISTEVLTAVQDQNERLMDKTIELSERVAEAKVAAATAVPEKRPSAELEAAQACIGLVTDSAKVMIEKASENSSRGLDPIAMMRAAGDLMKERPAAPATDPLPIVMGIMEESNKRIAEIQRQNFELMLKTLGPRTDGTANGNGSAPKTFIDQLRELKDMKELVGDMFGTNGKSLVRAEPAPIEPPKKGFVLSLLDAAADRPVETLTMVTTGLTMVSNILWNFMKPPAERVSPEAALKAQQAEAAAAQQQPTQQTAVQQPQPISREMRMQMFWGMLERPFLQHFLGQDRGLNGYTLAASICNEFDPLGWQEPATQQGRIHYEELRDKMGPQRFDAEVRAWPSLWDRINTVLPAPDPRIAENKRAERYAKFLSEFFTYYHWLEQQQQSAAQEQEGARV